MGGHIACVVKGTIHDHTGSIGIGPSHPHKGAAKTTSCKPITKTVPLPPITQSTAGSTTYDPSQTSRLETEPTSLNSAVLQLPEEAKTTKRNSVSCACARATVGSNRGRDLDLVAIGSQFDVDDTDAARFKPLSAFTGRAKDVRRDPFTSYSTRITRLGSDGARKQNDSPRHRANTDICLRLAEEGQAHPLHEVVPRQHPSPTHRLFLFAFMMLTVLTLNLMTFGIIWPTSDHPALRKGVLFGGLIALTIFVGGAMAAGGRSVMEFFTMASLVVTTGTLVQGLWFSGSHPP